jgi:hypothetical protein
MHLGLGHRYQEYTASEVFHLVTTTENQQRDPRKRRKPLDGECSQGPRLSIPQRQVNARSRMSNQTLSRSYLTALYDINHHIITALPHHTQNG